jgi:hypothetical protein
MLAASTITLIMETVSTSQILVNFYELNREKISEG